MRIKRRVVACVAAAVLAAPAVPATAGQSAVVLRPTLAWEHGAVQEPSVWQAGGKWLMLYTGGWERAALGLAVANRASGPWRKHGAPVLGLGHGGWSGPIAHANVYVESGTLYAYFPSHVDGGNLVVATAPLSDPSRWTTRGGAMAATPAAFGLVNTWLVKAAPHHYALMFESRGRQTWWQQGLATGNSPLGPFRIRAYPLPSLQRAPGAMYGGPSVTGRLHDWTIWYHAARNPGATLPTDIYTARSTDLIHWHNVRLVVEHQAPADQAADMDVVGSASFWSIMHNPPGAATGAIAYAPR